jgi:hypothetical protein
MELREIGYGDVNLIKQIQDKIMMVSCDENDDECYLLIY